MKFRIYIAAVAVMMMLPYAASAQNLDPTVEVNRAYEGKLLEVHKPAQEMAVPDSVQRFDLDFDYSVFENPYKGSYEFKPYQLLMKPLSTEKEYSQFFLKAGAGYTLYPQFDMVWSPRFTGKFKMNVYGDYDGYFGSYRTFKPDYVSGKPLYLSRWLRRDRTSSTWKGYRMKTRAGIDGRVDWKNGLVSFDLAYLGVASKDTLKNRAYDAFDMNVNVSSKPDANNSFVYDINLGYRFGEDKFLYGLSNGYVCENILDFGASLGSVIEGRHHMLFDVGMKTVMYSGALKGSASELSITPHYLLAVGRWNFDVGLRLAKVVKPEGSEMYGAKDQIIYPDVNVRFAAIKDAMNLYGKIGGGNVLNTYSSLIEYNPFVDPSYSRGETLLDTGVERVSIAIGADGRISKRFTYDISVGFVEYGNLLLDSVMLGSSSANGYSYLPAYAYASCSKLFASAGWNWHTDRIAFHGNVDYAHYTGLDSKEFVFRPASLTGDVSFEYNWNRRIFVGADCRFATARKGLLTSSDAGISATFEPVQAVIPGFWDLGINAEFAVSRKLSFWLRGGNLLNTTIQYTPLYAEKGINFTVGLCLKL